MVSLLLQTIFYRQQPRWKLLRNLDSSVQTKKVKKMLVASYLRDSSRWCNNHILGIIEWKKRETDGSFIMYV